MGKAVKETMKADAKKAAFQKRLVKELHLSSSESQKMVDDLVKKYGDNAYAIITNSLARPYEMAKDIDQKGRITSKTTLKHFCDNNIPTDNLAKALRKDKKEVEKNMPAKLKEVKKAKETVKKETKVSTPKASQTAKTLQVQERQDRFVAKTQQKKLSIEPVWKNMKQTKIEDWVKPVWEKKETPEDIYQKACGNKDATLDDLMKKAGVSKADLQAVLAEEKSLGDKAKLIQSMTPGKRNELMAHEADKTTGICQGDCLSGVQRMEEGAAAKEGVTPRIGKYDPEWKKHTRKGDDNGACNAHYVYDAHGDHVTVSVPNKACGMRDNSPENGEMKEFNRALPAGTIASTANKPEEVVRGTQNKSAKFGHIWVKDNHGNSCSDGVQPDGPKDFNRYGDKMYVTISTDVKVPKELALRLIEKAQERENSYIYRRNQAKVASR